MRSINDTSAQTVSYDIEEEDEVTEEIDDEFEEEGGRTAVVQAVPAVDDEESEAYGMEDVNYKIDDRKEKLTTYCIAFHAVIVFVLLVLLLYPFLFRPNIRYIIVNVTVLVESATSSLKEINSITPET
ncbi:unnamed protein product [Phyllotreta striolata]|uniref:Uncharacterized protein n=1 Tax=Phyllotreta striolata TaxID=444603 RepID=A0A9N9TFK9_PHYSR|nr:unnamed protein product [Phyllotreta striolata]